MTKVIGYKAQNAQIKQLKEYLAEIDKYRTCGVKIPRGVLIYGDSGVGKTSLAKSLSGNGIKMVALKFCSNISEEDISDIFKKARESAPCILLIDDVDKLVAKDDFCLEHTEDFIGIIAKELDKLKDNDGIFIAATASCPDDIRILVSTDRIDRLIRMDLPEEEDRKEIIKYYLGKYKINLDVDINRIAKLTMGFNCKRLKTMVNESVMETLRLDKNILTTKDVEDSVFCVEKDFYNDELTAEERYQVAVHEAGHTLASQILTPDVIKGVSIVRQKGAEGFVAMTNINSKSYSIDEMQDILAVGFGGRVAEKLVFGKYFMGAAADLNYVASRLKKLICDHCMCGFDYIFAGGNVAFGQFDSDLLRNRGAKLISKIMDDMQNKIEKILSANKDNLILLAHEIEKHRVMTKEELMEFFEKNKLCHVSA